MLQNVFTQKKLNKGFLTFIKYFIQNQYSKYDFSSKKQPPLPNFNFPTKRQKWERRRYH